MAETASQTGNMFGQKLYQARARAALPILVRQAFCENQIYYDDLAAELEMPNPRNLNYVLGSIGTTLNELSIETDCAEPPHIQSLVINQSRRLPGAGFDVFLAQRIGGYQKLSLADKRAYLKAYWHEIIAYPYWTEVLEACDLSPATSDASRIISKAKNGKGGGGGEGDEHRKLKEYVAANPHIVGLASNVAPGNPESPLPSGDRVDVLFDTPKRRIAVEIKSKISNDEDLTRGLFQCVKYRAVMEAERGIKGAQYSVETVLLLGSSLPKGLQSLKNALGVRVIEILDFN